MTRSTRTDRASEPDDLPALTGSEVVRIEVPAEPEYLSLVRLVVASAARLDPFFDEDRVDDLRIIVSEAVTNAIEASTAAAEQGGTEAPRVVVQCRLAPSRLEVQVGDEGAGFDPARPTEMPAANDPDRLRQERGLGLPLIRALADEVAIDSGPEGTTVRIVLYSDPDGVVGLS